MMRLGAEIEKELQKRATTKKIQRKNSLNMINNEVSLLNGTKEKLV